jgi:hypothetical protein
MARRGLKAAGHRELTEATGGFLYGLLGGVAVSVPIRTVRTIDQSQVTVFWLSTPDSHNSRSAIFICHFAFF